MRLLFVLLIVGVILLLVSSFRDVSSKSKRRISKSLLTGLAIAAVGLIFIRFGFNWLVVAVGAVVATLARLLPAVVRLWPLIGFFRNRGRPPPGFGGPGGATPGGHVPPRGNRMTRDEALRILELSEGATKDEIMQAYRRVMKTAHPDHGGSSYLAAKVNEAKDVLLAG